MPDAEAWKLIMNGGMLGLWAIFVVWLLFYGAPMFKSVMEKFSTDNRETAALLATKHEAAVAALARECREERQQAAEASAEERVKFIDALEAVTRNGQTR